MLTFPLQINYPNKTSIFFTLDNSKNNNQWMMYHGAKDITNIESRGDIFFNEREYRPKDPVLLSANDLLNMAYEIRHAILSDENMHEKEPLNLTFQSNPANFIMRMQYRGPGALHAEEYDAYDVGISIDRYKAMLVKESGQEEITRRTDPDMKLWRTEPTCTFRTEELIEFTFALEAEARPHCTKEEWQAHVEKGAPLLEKLKEKCPEAFVDSSEEKS